MKIPEDFDPMITRDRLAVGCQTMKDLLKGLLDSNGRVADEVHAVRKLGKSLRGGFTLFRLEKSAALEIQAIGRLLSGPRDAVSRFNTWKKLGWEGDPELAAAISELLDQHTHSAARRPPKETVAWCLTRVDAACACLLEAPEESLGTRISKGLSKIEKTMRKRCARLDHRAEHDFHEARKALKAWLGATEFLPEGSVPSNADVSNLAELLGDENDLATLLGWLQAHGFTEHFAPDLWKAIQISRKKIQTKAIRMAGKPQNFALVN